METEGGDDASSLRSAAARSGFVGKAAYRGPHDDDCVHIMSGVGKMKSESDALNWKKERLPTIDFGGNYWSESKLLLIKSTLNTTLYIPIFLISDSNQILFKLIIIFFF